MSVYLQFGVVIDQLTSRGVMDASAQYKPPFSHLHSGGPDELFSGKENVIERILDKLEVINSVLNAQAE